MQGRSYRDLIAWQKAMDLVEGVHRLTRSWSKEEQYGLTNQVRRAVTSIPANIAEGQSRDTSRDFARFLIIADGSLHEVETFLLIAVRLEYSQASDVQELLSATAEIGRLIHGLLRSIN